MKFAIAYVVVGELLGLYRAMRQEYIVSMSGRPWAPHQEARTAATMIVWAIAWPAFVPLLVFFSRRQSAGRKR
jgi:hypothetical protein